MASSHSNPSFSVEDVSLENGRIAKRAKTNAIGAKPQYAGCVRVGPYIFMAGNIRKTLPNVSHVMAVLNIKASTWEFVPYNGASVSGVGMFLYEDTLFSLSVNDHLNSRSGVLTCFDLAMNEWSYHHTVGGGPGPRKYFSGDFLEKLNQYVVFGGMRADNGRRVDNTVYLLDMPERRWSTAIANGTPAPGRIQHGSCVHNGLIYIYGGWGSLSRCNDGLYILKVGNGRRVTWSSPRTNAQLIGPLSSFAFLSIGRILLLCGGAAEYGTPRLSYYDTALHEFRKAELRPASVVFGSCISGCMIENGHSIAVLGGRNSLRNMVRVTIENV